MPIFSGAGSSSGSGAIICRSSFSSQILLNKASVVVVPPGAEGVSRAYWIFNSGKTLISLKGAEAEDDGFPLEPGVIFEWSDLGGEASGWWAIGPGEVSVVIKSSEEPGTEPPVTVPVPAAIVGFDIPGEPSKPGGTFYAATASKDIQISIDTTEYDFLNYPGFIIYQTTSLKVDGYPITGETGSDLYIEEQGTFSFSWAASEFPYIFFFYADPEYGGIFYFEINSNSNTLRINGVTGVY